MEPNIVIGGIYVHLNSKVEFYLYLGNSRIYCCDAPNKLLVGKVFEHPSYINWLRADFMRIA